MAIIATSRANDQGKVIHFVLDPIRGWQIATPEQEAAWNWPPPGYGVNTASGSWSTSTGQQVAPLAGWVNTERGPVQQTAGGVNVGVAPAAPVAPVAPVAPAAPVAPVAPVEITGPQNIPPGYGPYQEYLASQGLGGLGYMNPAQKYMAGQYGPIRDVYELFKPFAPTMLGKEGRVPDWREFLSQMGGAPADIYGQATGMLQSLFNMTPLEREKGGLGFEPTYNEFGEMRQTSETGQRGISDLVGLVGAALRNRYAGGASQWLAGRIPFVQEAWQGERAGAKTTQTFVDYLRNYLRL